MSRLFLGLDSSTQSLSAVVIDLDTGKVVYDKSLNFDKALPHYRTRNGTLRCDDPLVVHSPPLMWVEALETMLDQMQQDGVPMGEILAVSGSGQQHGSVYMNARAEHALKNLDPRRCLAHNLEGIFSRPTSPIWMDSSTAVECAEIREALGGLKATVQATGSDTFERFTGPQIRKFHKTDPDAYGKTASIGLVSSFMASVLAGRIAPIDHGDGAGMNLMDIRTKDWHRVAFIATAPQLRRKLPPLAAPWKVVGKISPFYVKRYGMNPETRSLVWSGDNPCSLIGLGLLQEGTIAISLGTSYTLFGCMKRCRTDERGGGHVFGAPNGDYMSLICFKNGSLAREQVRDAYKLDWEKYNKLMATTKPGNGGAMMLPWFESEIVPRVHKAGVHRLNLDANDAAGNCRAIVEAQMMSMRVHSGWMKVKPKLILATGGGSVNPSFLQVMADVMNCPVARIEVSKSAALGAALRAAHGYYQYARTPVTWKKLVTPFTATVPGSEVKPNAAAVKVYDKMVVQYAKWEREVLAGLDTSP